MKFVKKAIRSTKRAVKKRYGIGSKRGLNFGTVAKDVARMAQMINAEKKIFGYAPSTYDVAQVNLNSTGAILLDITPLIGKGLGAGQITGNSYKMHSALYQFQFTQQASTNIAQKVIIDFFINTGQPVDPSISLDQLWASATFSTIIDANSPRNTERYQDYKHIRQIKRTIPSDQLSGIVQTITFDVPMKFNRGKGHHVRLSSATTPTSWLNVLNGQLLMTVRADVGNSTGFGASSLPVPVTNVVTGSTMRFGYKTWFYDN